MSVHSGSFDQGGADVALVEPSPYVALVTRLRECRDHGYSLPGSVLELIDEAQIAELV